MKIAYGYTIEPHKRDPLGNLASEAMDQFGKAGVPGAWLVDLIPACTLGLFSYISVQNTLADRRK
jgi:hypothetical protein